MGNKIIEAYKGQSVELTSGEEGALRLAKQLKSLAKEEGATTTRIASSVVVDDQDASSARDAYNKMIQGGGGPGSSSIG